MPSGSAVTADFRCSTLVSGTPTTRRTQRLQCCGQLIEAGPVRAAAETDPHGSVVLEHVAAVEGPGILDTRDPIAEPSKHLLDRGGLGLALVGTGTRDDRQVAVHDHGVLDEDRVWTVICGWDLDRLPTLVVQRGDVAIPLTLRQIQIDAGTLDVSDQPFGAGGDPAGVRARTCSLGQGTSMPSPPTSLPLVPAGDEARGVLGSMLVSENPRRASGTPPYWQTGAQILWWSGEGPLAAGVAKAKDADCAVPYFAEPVTVVRDDADGLVVWLATGTPVRRVARADGRGKRDDKSTLFTAESVQEFGVWAVYDVLRIAPTGRPWSVWVLFAEHTGEFAGWYVNLEEPRTRDEQGVYTRDRVLDLVIDPDRTMARKDEDELALAVEQGRFDAATAAAIEQEAADAEAVVAAWGSPFCDGWEHFRPDPAWPIPRF